MAPVTPIDWQDEPSTLTPINAANLKHHDAWMAAQVEAAQVSANAAAASAAAAAAPGDDQVAAFVADATPSATRAQLDGRYVTKGSLVYNVRDYGAVGDGVTDDTAAIQAALDAAQAASGGLVFIPAGDYLTSATVTIPAADIRLQGAGRGVTRLVCNSTTANMITIPLGATRAAVGNMTLDRTAIGTAGAGIYCYEATGLANYVDFHDLHIRQQFRGIHVGPVSWGEIRNLVIERCADDGIHITNNTVNGACQWQITNVLSQLNGGHGFRVLAQNIGAAQITLGQWTNVATFANTGSGIAFYGLSTCPIQDVRVTNAFLGDDGASEIYLDTWAGSHEIVSPFVELVGSRTTGPTTSTPASGTGYGVQVSANNDDVTITGGLIVANARSGIYTSAAKTILTGVKLRANGTNGEAGAAFNSGVYNAGGRLTMTGCAAWGQLYGEYTMLDSVLVVGNDLAGNTTAATGTAVTLTNSIVANNRIA